jgi:protein TonB
VGADDRLGFTLFLAIALHTVILLGISFKQEDRPPPPHTMAITLARFDDKKAPDKADYLAQTNQQGSGTLKKKAEITSPEKAPYQNTEVKHIARPTLPSPPEKSTAARKNVITTVASSDIKVSDKLHKKNSAKTTPKRKPSLLERSLEIASLEAQYKEQVQEYAKRPRITRLTATSTMKTADAYYIRNWQQKIERVGNLNYPEQAREQKIYGHPRLLVALYPDGTVKEVKVLYSSGYKILDDAAVRIVRLASPFPPFTKSMRKDRDILEIIRTFSFQRKGLSSY